MKTKSIIYSLLVSLGLSGTVSSCKDMLSPESEALTYESAKDTLYNYWGILREVQKVAERHVLLGELRGDLVMANRYDGDAYLTDSLRGIYNFTSVEDGDCRHLCMADYYAIINNCNTYLASADLDRKVAGTNKEYESYFLREYAQISAIRAWTYLQLVNNYGEVPFYTKPLTSTDDILNSNFPMVSADNLWQQSEMINPLIELEEKIMPILESTNATLVNPSLGEYKSLIHSSYTMFPIQLVLGDIYLASATKQGAELAAKQYYNWLMHDNRMKTNGNALLSGNHSVPHYGLGTNITYQADYNCFALGNKERGNGAEAITVIPSNENTRFGIVNTAIGEAFGFEYSSRISQQKEKAKDEDSEEETIESATMTIKNSYTQRRQFIASRGFESLCKSYPIPSITTIKDASDTVIYSKANNLAAIPTYAADGRYGAYMKVQGAKNSNNDNVNDSCFIVKQNLSGSKVTASNTYPVIYRKGLVWLRLAEAINRAGYPEWAFAILREGAEFIPHDDDNVIAEFKDSVYFATGVDIDPTGALAPLPNGKNWLLPKNFADGVTITKIGDSDVVVDDQPAYMGGSTVSYIVHKAPINTGMIMTRELYNKYMSATEVIETEDAESVILYPGNLQSYFGLYDQPEFMMVLGSNNASVRASGYIPAQMWAPSRGLRTGYKDSYLNFSQDAFKRNQYEYRNGVHARGTSQSKGREGQPSGYLLSWNDDIYSFDAAIGSKWNEAVNTTGMTSSVSANYPGQMNYYTATANGQSAEYEAFRKVLEEAVELLIIDELALETCFEGNRYPDLLRFSRRLEKMYGTDRWSWITDRVNRRDPGHGSVTITAANGYLRLPASIRK